VTDLPRRRVAYPSALAASVTCGAAGEVAFRTVASLHSLAAAWASARLPLVALLTVLVAQVPLERRRRVEPRTQRPRSSELHRHLERRVRRAED
jgi:hypothetical protein